MLIYDLSSRFTEICKNEIFQSLYRYFRLLNIYYRQYLLCFNNDNDCYRYLLPTLVQLFVSQRTKISLFEEAFLFSLLDCNLNYEPGQTFLFKPNKAESFSPLFGARIVVYYTSVVVPVLIANLSSERVVLPKVKVLALETDACARLLSLGTSATSTGVTCNPMKESKP